MQTLSNTFKVILLLFGKHDAPFSFKEFKGSSKWEISSFQDLNNHAECCELDRILKNISYTSWNPEHCRTRSYANTW